VGRILVAVLAGATGGLTAAGSAAAHGAPDQPMSRTAACAPDGPYEASAVCQAALAASDRMAFEDWDYVRVAGVAGRDREVIPDGALCSGGAPGFAGLDLPRADWPVTELAAGAELTVTYRTTIPHLGTFRMYLTRDGYDPEQPLAWSDLDDEPFLTATDSSAGDSSATVALATGGAAVALAGGVGVAAIVARHRRGRTGNGGPAARPRGGSHRPR
jgi:chitin-binding protein